MYSGFEFKAIFRATHYRKFTLCEYILTRIKTNNYYNCDSTLNNKSIKNPGTVFSRIDDTNVSALFSRSEGEQESG